MFDKTICWYHLLHFRFPLHQQDRSKRPCHRSPEAEGQTAHHRAGVQTGGKDRVLARKGGITPHIPTSSRSNISWWYTHCSVYTCLKQYLFSTSCSTPAPLFLPRLCHYNCCCYVFAIFGSCRFSFFASPRSLCGMAREPWVVPPRPPKLGSKW